MNRKMVVSSLALVMSMGMVAGCGAVQNSSEGANGMNTVEETTTSAEEKVEEPTEKVTVQVFIAASLKNAMMTIQEDYKKLHPEVEIVFNADSSGTLQKQIEEGASCDIFFSAAMKQMNALDEEGLVVEGTSEKVLENKVVLIKPKGEETAVTGFEDITEANNLALAGEDVPVGAYSREIFKSLGILNDVMKMEINEGANVTAVLAAVSEASNEVGIVYATDAASIKDEVEIIAEAPADALKNPVVYPVARIKNEEADEDEKDAAQEFLQYLTTDEAAKVFEEYGFTRYNS